MGAIVGAELGAEEGTSVGALVGTSDGAVVGLEVGASVGAPVGAAVGSAVGLKVGAAVGAFVETERTKLSAFIWHSNISSSTSTTVHAVLPTHFTRVFRLLHSLGSCGPSTQAANLCFLLPLGSNKTLHS